MGFFNLNKKKQEAVLPPPPPPNAAGLPPSPKKEETLPQFNPPPSQKSVEMPNFEDQTSDFELPNPSESQPNWLDLPEGMMDEDLDQKQDPSDIPSMPKSNDFFFEDEPPAEIPPMDTNDESDTELKHFDDDFTNPQPMSFSADSKRYDEFQSLTNNLKRDVAEVHEEKIQSIEQRKTYSAGGPVFIRASHLREVLEDFSAVGNRLDKIKARSIEFEEEEKIYENWRGSLEGVFRRLNAIDKSFFTKGDQ